jgi:hypothetical protein
MATIASTYFGANVVLVSLFGLRAARRGDSDTEMVALLVALVSLLAGMLIAILQLAGA